MDKPPQSQLYLSLSAEAWRSGSDALAKALRMESLACIRIKGPFEDGDAPRITKLVDIAHRAERPLLIVAELEEALALAEQCGADGVHIPFSGDAVERARDTLGEDGVVGVSIRDSRHNALIAAEAGADYIAFSTPWPDDNAPPELIEWWASMIETPMVVETANTDERLRVIGAIAEFVTVHADSAGEIVEKLQAARTVLM